MLKTLKFEISYNNKSVIKLILLIFNIYIYIKYKDNWNNVYANLLTSIKRKLINKKSLL